MAEATSIETASNKLNTTIGSINYDFLVIACGSDTNFFGNSGFKKFATGLNSVTDALDIRSRILQNLERASVTCIENDKKKLSSVAIVGGGATGVEIAGALAEFKRYILPKDYPELKGIEMKIYLIEAAGSLLQSMPEKLSLKTLKYLSDMKVDILLNTSVDSFNGGEVILENGQILNASTFIWTAGVKGTPVKGLSSESIDRQNRILTDDFGRVLTLENVFAIGDNAILKSPGYPNGQPMVAQPAIQQGKTLAKNFVRLIKNEPMAPFEYQDKGTMATIGKKKAVASIKKLEFSGFFAWFIWSFIHLISLIGFRNKIMVAINWTWSYFTYDKGNRLIIRRYDEKR
jgi:NADH dehydrogenase